MHLRNHFERFRDSFEEARELRESMAVLISFAEHVHQKYKLGCVRTCPAVAQPPGGVWERWAWRQLTDASASSLAASHRMCAPGILFGNVSAAHVPIMQIP